MSRREDVLKQELSALQLRLQEADERNEQLVESMGGATLPLLRQIENLKVHPTPDLLHPHLAKIRV